MPIDTPTPVDENEENTETPEAPSGALSELFEETLVVMLEDLSGQIGMSCQPYEEYPAKPKIGIGWYTYPGRRTIYYNPYHIAERGPLYSFPIVAHEIGHHHPDIKKFQDMCSRLGPDYSHLFPDALPSAKLLRDLDNISADIYLERRNSTGIYEEMMWELNCRALAQDFLSPEDFEEHEGDFNEDNFPWEKATSPKEKSLRIQQFRAGLLLMAKFGLPPEEVFHEEVQEALEIAYAHVQTIANPNLKQVTISHKMHAQIQIYSLAAELLEKDVEEGRIGEAEEGEEGDCKSQEKGEQKEGGRDGRIKEIIKMLEKGEAKHGAKAAPVGGKPGSSGEIGEATAQIGANIDEALQGLFDKMVGFRAGALAVAPDKLRDYLAYIEQHEAQIQHFTAILTNMLLKDRVLKRKTGKRQGVMVQPGLGVQTYHQILSGDPHPPTQIGFERQLKPLVLQAALALDVSGSTYQLMDGLLGLVAIFVESIRRIHEQLLGNPRKYNFDPRRDRNPGQLELTRFADTPECILPMGNLVDLPAAITAFSDLQAMGGGTSISTALEFEYDRLTKNISHDQIVRILVLVTDGLDQGAALDAIVKKITEDPRIYFIVAGIGPNHMVQKAIIKQYQKFLNPQNAYRMWANGFQSVGPAIGEIIAFFERKLMEERAIRDQLLRKRSG